MLSTLILTSFNYFDCFIQININILGLCFSVNYYIQMDN